MKLSQQSTTDTAHVYLKVSPSNLESLSLNKNTFACKQINKTGILSLKCQPTCLFTFFFSHLSHLTDERHDGDEKDANQAKVDGTHGHDEQHGIQRNDGNEGNGRRNEYSHVIWNDDGRRMLYAYGHGR